MGKINLIKRRFLLLGITLSIFIVLGIIMIVFGAVFWIIELLVMGITFFVISFYSTPFVWLVFAKKCKDKKIISHILNGNLDIKVLSNNFDMIYRKFKARVEFLIINNYLKGYKFVGNDNLIKIGLNKCANCGADINQEETKNICPYCKSVN